MTAGVTGHRDVEQEPGELDRFARLSVARIVCGGHSEIITGMARGWDLAVAMACIDLRFPFVAAVPFIRQAEHWSPADKARWDYCLVRAHHVNIGGTLRLNSAYHERNRWIVDESDELWSFYDGRIPSGTRHCTLYAEGIGRKVVPLWQDWLSFRRQTHA